jgi:hypothetical protein
MVGGGAGEVRVASGVAPCDSHSAAVVHCCAGAAPVPVCARTGRPSAQGTLRGLTLAGGHDPGG